MAIKLIPVLLVALMLLVGFVVVVVLIANRRTRAVGLTLLVLGFFGLAVLLAAGMFVSYRAVQVEHTRAESARALRELGREMHQYSVPSEESHLPAPPPAEAFPPEATGSSGSVNDTQPPGVLQSVGQALRRAIVETEAEQWTDRHPPPREPPTETAPSPPRDPGEAEEGGAEETSAAGVPQESESEFAEATRMLRSALAILSAWEDSAAARDAEGGETAPLVLPVGMGSGPRPDWVGRDARRVDGAYEMTASVGPYATRLECERALPAELDAVVADYVERYLGGAFRDRVRLPLDYLRDRVIAEEWEEVRQTSVGPMLQLHVLLSFDSQVNTRLKAIRDQMIVGERLRVLALSIGSVLAAVATAFLYLKADLATGGAYRGWLRVGALTALAAIGGGVYLLLAVAPEPAAAWPAVEQLERPAAEGGRVTTVGGGAFDGSVIQVASPEPSVAHGEQWVVVRYTASWFAVGLLALGMLGMVGMLAFRRTRVLALALVALLLVLGLIMVA